MTLDPYTDADGYSIDNACAEAGVSRETRDRLAAYVGLLDRWRVRHNLIGPEERGRLFRRHIYDSLQLLSFVSPGATRVLDLGSGAGFPGLVLACALADRLGFEMSLVESNVKKASFLRAAAREAKAPVRVLNQRITDVSRETFDHVTARALAPLPRLFDHVTDFLSQEASAILLKGRDL
ncbi:MAG: 16S rRNA (guanine(527)-N(7))-methyltransferase RsmG, partial [Pseudomonadota bacterium]